ncbi:hypothetical protein [Actinocrispum sp. NPDC049592]|uniref:hypothetical protein n=1 Tax=Actinocrispum sp. NPDC049592 TaxID=3154835 RepID=UPI00341C493B
MSLSLCGWGLLVAEKGEAGGHQGRRLEQGLDQVVVQHIADRFANAVVTDDPEDLRGEAFADGFDRVGGGLDGPGAAR